MKKIKYSIFAALALVMGACSQSQEEITPKSESTAQIFTVVTDLGVQSRAAFDTSKSFYIYIDQTVNDYFAVMKYDNATSSWKAYSVADGTTEIELLVNDKMENVTVAALYCDDLSISSSQFTSDTTYSIGDNDFYYATNGSNANGSVSITEDGVISIAFGLLLSRLDITLTGTNVDNLTSIAVSGISESFTWNALTNSTPALAETSAVTPTTTDGTVYSCYVAPQSATALKVSATVDAKSYVYNIGEVTFAEGESQSVTLNVE